MFKFIEEIERLLGMKPDSDDVSAVSPHHWASFHDALNAALEKAKHIAILTGQMPDSTAHPVSQPSAPMPAPMPEPAPPVMDMPPVAVDDPPVPAMPAPEMPHADTDHDAEHKDGDHQ